MKLIAAGRVAEAAHHFAAAARLEPDHSVWHYNCALAFQQLGRLTEAIGSYRRAAGLAPQFFDAWNNLSAAAKSAGDFETAEETGRRAVALNPRAASARLNLGNALKARGDLTAAEAAYRQALGLEPGNPRMQVNLANTLREAGRVGEAIELLRQVLERHPQFAEAHRDLAFALFISGDLPAGWVENEWRWETGGMQTKRRAFDQPPWNGEELAGRRLLVHTEQGFGDALQFIRFVPVLAGRGARVIVECQPALHRLFRSLAGVTELVVRGEPLPGFDFHVPLLSVPRVLRIGLKTIPNRVPYLTARPEPSFDGPPGVASRPKVGVVWAGNPAHLNDRGRSIPFEVWAPLFELDHITFVSLQVGERARDLKNPSLGGRVWDCGARLIDFASTASAIAGLDLVIGVDTAVVHLAGALGQPVWILLPYAPDWRWLLDRDDSPWYPTMRLFRQAQPGDWTRVMEEVRTRLASLEKR